MARSFSELREKMPAQRRHRNKAAAHQMMAEMLLAEIRRQTGRTQTELAEALGIQQPSLSKLESQEDMQISTLRRIVEALGGDLELVARMPQGPVRISQFKGEAQHA